MLNNTPLSIAANALANSTIDAVRRSPSFHARAWHILDRWAFNSPKQLPKTEAEGEVILLERLLRQQEIEQQALTSFDGLAQRGHGLTEHEVLALHDISLAL